MPRCPCCNTFIVGKLRGWPVDSSDFTNEVKVQFAEFLAVHGGAASWEGKADRLRKRLGEDGDHWHQLCRTCNSRFAEALSEFREAKARQVPGREGRVQQREARALAEQQQQQKEERKRRRGAVQQQQQQEQEGNGDGQPCRLGRTRAATASAAAVQAAAVAAAATAAAPASPAAAIGAAAAAAAAAGVVAAALGVGGSGGSGAGRAQGGGWSSASATPTRSRMQIQEHGRATTPASVQQVGHMSPPASARQQLFPVSPGGTTQPLATSARTPGGGGAPKRAKVAAPQPVPTRRPKHRPFASMEAPQLRELAREASKEKKGKDAKLQRQARVIAIQNRIITDSEQKVKAAHFAAGAWSLRRLRPALLP